MHLVPILGHGPCKKNWLGFSVQLPWLGVARVSHVALLTCGKAMECGSIYKALAQICTGFRKRVGLVDGNCACVIDIPSLQLR